MGDLKLHLSLKACKNLKLGLYLFAIYSYSMIFYSTIAYVQRNVTKPSQNILDGVSKYFLEFLQHGISHMFE